MKTKYKIATVGSHTALQILKGAKDEGFETICITPPKRTKMYASFGVTDKIFKIKDWGDFSEIEKLLIQENAILIPHASLVEYLGIEKVLKLKCLHYGTKEILELEHDREKQRNWLVGAGIKTPLKFDTPEEIDRLSIVKFHGARGGHGYFLTSSYGEFVQKMEKHNESKYAIQEYVIGVPVYAHYFFGRNNNSLEIMSFDKRYEANADSIGRISAKDQINSEINTSYTIVGNIPLVVRESLLPEFWEMGMNVVKESRKICPPKGLYGPFCLECVVDANLKIKVFEISARIVAGTNPFIDGSPYTKIKYNESMSTGRRIARDIKEMIESGKNIEKLLS